MGFSLQDLARFLVKAKKNTYAGDGKEVSSQRPDFDELEFIEGDFEYRDSYFGLYQAPGQEVVRYKGKPVWLMAYSGGMKKQYHKDLDFAEQTYAFLRKVLSQVEESKPFRGPDSFKEEDYEYINKVEGDITQFKGRESILYKGEEVFIHDYIGELVVSK